VTATGPGALRPAILQRGPLTEGQERPSPADSEKARKKPKDEKDDDEKGEVVDPRNPPPISLAAPHGTRSHQSPEEARKPPERPTLAR
jgi:hypothetical protein